MIDGYEPQAYPLELEVAGKRYLVVGWFGSAADPSPIAVPLGVPARPVILLSVNGTYALPGAGEPTKVRGARPPQLSGPANAQQA